MESLFEKDTKFNSIISYQKCGCFACFQKVRLEESLTIGDTQKSIMDYVKPVEEYLQLGKDSGDIFLVLGGSVIHCVYCDEEHDIRSSIEAICQITGASISDLQCVSYERLVEAEAYEMLAMYYVSTIKAGRNTRKPVFTLSGIGTSLEKPRFINEETVKVTYSDLEKMYPSVDSDSEVEKAQSVVTVELNDITYEFERNHHAYNGAISACDFLEPFIAATVSQVKDNHINVKEHFLSMSETFSAGSINTNGKKQWEAPEMVDLGSSKPEEPEKKEWSEPEIKEGNTYDLKKKDLKPVGTGIFANLNSLK